MIAYTTLTPATGQAGFSLCAAAASVLDVYIKERQKVHVYKQPKMANT